MDAYPVSIVQIDTTSSTAAKELVAASAGGIPRLHALRCNLSAAGALTIASQTTAGSSTLTNVTGPATWPQNTGPQWAFEKSKAACPFGQTGGNLQLSTTAALIKGYAIVSNTTD